MNISYTTTNLISSTVSQPYNFVPSESELEKIMTAAYEEMALRQRMSNIRADIGYDLFDKLSYEDQVIMANTAGAVDFGYEVDLDKIAQAIRDYDPPEQ